MVTKHEFKAGMQRLASSVCVIATADRDNPHGKSGWRGFTATAVMSVSDSPPTLGVGINKSTRAHDVIMRAGRFSVNILQCEQDDIADTFAGRTGADGGERFETGDWLVSGEGCPLLAGTLATFECSLLDRIDAGTHTIAIGRIERVRLPDTEVSAPTTPLVYWYREYGGVCPIPQG